jgi:hypothetical protein
MTLDLLTPGGGGTGDPSELLATMRQNYIHQLSQTIDAYLPSYVFLGEAIQNALDAVREAGGGAHEINVKIDLDERTVTVSDNGVGFPDKPNLLYLGGGEKFGRGLAGLVGVGLKVVLFSSSRFTLRTTNQTRNLRVDIVDAYRYREEAPPPLELPDVESLPADPTPLFTAGTGTEIVYTFPPGDDGVPERFFRDVAEECLSIRDERGYAKSLAHAVASGQYPNRLAALLASYLRRFSYLGSTRPPEELEKLAFNVKLVANDTGSLGPALVDFVDGEPEVEITIPPSYLTVKDTLAWAPTPKPVVRKDPVGEGGSNLTKTKLAFNVTTYENDEEYEQLLAGANGRTSPELETFQRLLFPKLRSVQVTIGRIPQFDMYLPGSSRRIISARGVVTGHDIAISSGQNQQYVRCLDLIIDVDADLNYGKTQLTDMHLVANVRKYVNEAYRLTLQNAARNFVGTIKSADPIVEKFWTRPALEIDLLTQTRVPYDENDVIALFFELAGRGHFPEFRWYGLSSRDTYDGRALIKRSSDPETILTEPDLPNLRVVEFKLRGASVARDFDHEEKDIDDIDLVICYEIGESPVDMYQVVDIEDSEVAKSPQGAYQGVTHVIFDTLTGKEVQVLALRPVLDELTGEDSTPAEMPDEVEESD